MPSEQELENYIINVAREINTIYKNKGDSGMGPLKKGVGVAGPMPVPAEIKELHQILQEHLSNTYIKANKLTNDKGGDLAEVAEAISAKISDMKPKKASAGASLSIAGSQASTMDKAYNKIIEHTNKFKKIEPKDDPKAALKGGG